MDKVQHFEIPANNVEKAKKFYSDVFGWKIAKAPGEMPYWMVYTTEVDDKFMAKETNVINGGLFKKQKDEAVIIVITVGSIDDKLKKIKSAGGKVVMEKQPVGDMGFYAKFKDTEGNVIGVWENPKK